MAKEYTDLVKFIVDNVGGEENIKSAINCQTRLRFVLKDDNKPNREALKEHDEIMSIVENNGQFQVVIGMHVQDVYNELEDYLGTTQATTEPSSTEDDVAPEKQSPLNAVTSFISDVFNPTIIAITGSGMLKAVLAALSFLNILSGESQTYQFINMMADAVFYFLPVLLAYTTARKMKANALLALTLAVTLLHPTFLAMVGEGAPVAIFGIPVRLFSYASSVFPIILIIIAQSYVEKIVNKVIPRSVNLIFAPMFILLITGTLALTVIGPIGGYAGDIIVQGFFWLQEIAPWLVPTLVGATLPLMVMFGIHHSVGPIGSIQLASVGHDGLFGPGALMSNIAQGTAALIVGLRSKDENIRQVGIANGFTGLMGVTEPALFSINLPKRYPLIAALIGGGAGGFYAGITRTIRFGVGSSGIPAVTLYIGEDTSNVVNVLIAIAITIVVTAILTIILGNRAEKRGEA